MKKYYDNYPPCVHFGCEDCFARLSGGQCDILTDTYFNGKKCSFYKKSTPEIMKEVEKYRKEDKDNFKKKQRRV